MDNSETTPSVKQKTLERKILPKSSMNINKLKDLYDSDESIVVTKITTGKNKKIVQVRSK